MEQKERERAEGLAWENPQGLDEMELYKAAERFCTKLVGGRCWIQTHVALVGLTTRNFPRFFKSFVNMGQIPLERPPMEDSLPSRLIFLAQVIGRKKHQSTK